MKVGLSTPDTDFSRDVLGRYVCNTFDEMLVTIDPNARMVSNNEGFFFRLGAKRRLRGWAYRTRTQKCRRKLSL